MKKIIAIKSLTFRRISSDNRPPSRRAGASRRHPVRTSPYQRQGSQSTPPYTSQRERELAGFQDASATLFRSIGRTELEARFFQQLNQSQQGHSEPPVHPHQDQSIFRQPGLVDDCRQHDGEEDEEVAGLFENHDPQEPVDEPESGRRTNFRAMSSSILQRDAEDLANNEDILSAAFGTLETSHFKT